jgi:hypothetical protein
LETIFGNRGKSIFAIASLGAELAKAGLFPWSPRGSIFHRTPRAASFIIGICGGHR